MTLQDCYQDAITTPVDELVALAAAFIYHWEELDEETIGDELREFLFRISQSANDLLMEPE